MPEKYFSCMVFIEKLQFDFTYFHPYYKMTLGLTDVTRSGEHMKCWLLGQGCKSYPPCWTVWLFRGRIKLFDHFQLKKQKGEHFLLIRGHSNNT